MFPTQVPAFATLRDALLDQLALQPSGQTPALTAQLDQPSPGRARRLGRGLSHVPARHCTRRRRQHRRPSRSRRLGRNDPRPDFAEVPRLAFPIAFPETGLGRRTSCAQRLEPARGTDRFESSPPTTADRGGVRAAAHCCIARGAEKVLMQWDCLPVICAAICVVTSALLWSGQTEAAERGGPVGHDGLLRGAQGDLVLARRRCAASPPPGLSCCSRRSRCGGRDRPAPPTGCGSRWDRHPTAG